MMKNILSGISGCAIVFLASCNMQKTDSTPPNILFLLADDLGYGELGCYGQEVIKTPAIDELAKNGMLFTNFYAGNTVCSPSRAVLLTGKHPGNATIRGNSGIFDDDLWDRIPLKKDDLTLGEMLKRAGYQTGFIGKWHLDDPNDLTTWAYNRGFDFAIQDQWSARTGGSDFAGNMHYINGKEDSLAYDPIDYDCIDEFRTDLAFHFLDRRDKNHPFFLFMSYRIPHAHEWNIRDKELYADKGWPENFRRHAAKITLLDQQIGRLLKRLEDDGELENTIIFFTSDNGPHSELGHDHMFFNSSGGLRGFKRDLYEGGIRVPLIIAWPNKIQPGIVTDRISAFQDIMPTLAELAGIDIPAQSDGISLLPVLAGKEQKEHDYLYWEFQLDGWYTILPDGGFRQAIRMGKWKAVRYGINVDTELFDLDADLFERTNIADKHPELVQQMNSLFESSRTDTDHFPYGGKVQPYRAIDRFKLP